MARALEVADDPASVAAADAVYWQGAFAGIEGDHVTAERFSERARELFEIHGDQARLARACLDLGAWAAAMGQNEKARLYLEQARAHAERVNDDYWLAHVRMEEAVLEAATGNYEAALEGLDDSVAILRKIGAPRRSWLYQLPNVAYIAIEQHDFDLARKKLEEYLTAELTSVGTGIAHALLGIVAIHQDNRDEAASRFREALVCVRDSRHRDTVALSLYGLAAVAAIDGDNERALRLWGAASEVRNAMRSPLRSPEQFLVERYLKPASSLLPEATEEQVRSQGAAMSLDEAVAYALDGAEGTTAQADAIVAPR